MEDVIVGLLGLIGLAGFGLFILIYFMSPRRQARGEAEEVPDPRQDPEVSEVSVRVNEAIVVVELPKRIRLSEQALIAGLFSELKSNGSVRLVEKPKQESEEEVVLDEEEVASLAATD